MEIRNAQTLCRPGTIVFAVLVGVLILNLQPEAVSEEFVEAAWYQVSCRGGFVRVGVDVSTTMAGSAVLYREKSEAKAFPVRRERLRYLQSRRGTSATVTIILSSSLGRVELCVASPRIRREPPCSLSCGRCVTSSSSDHLKHLV